MNRGWRRYGHALWPSLTLVLLFLFIWEATVRLLDVEPWLLPSPSKIGDTFFTSLTLLHDHMWVTLQEALLGFALGIIVALLLATLIELSPWIRRALYPLLIGTQTVPIIAIAPLFIVWFGFGMFPKLLIVAMVTFFPVVISTADGLRSSDPDMIRLLQSAGANQWQLFRYIRFPHALPSFFSGCKIAATYSILGAVIGEWLGASKGLGVFLIRAQHSFAADKVFVAILVITFWSILLFLLIQVIQRWLTPWTYIKTDDERIEET
ncbi:ABC transporter permease [Mechercharimyces sp. CAU 1602]|uniref:ABC transporter permease n=1 Tax=Mechercharimyces sp. CAU 1602 TaxID=2973933 RepID=UPI002162B08B|nr:ABC transporter permease [Mechercharimyces sp. CAU 1602]MCS1352336.1 ABC transporter permease [Mechercharimyces sp. CAU 1602]